jgi:SAM-dependent methyltransferase
MYAIGAEQLPSETAVGASPVWVNLSSGQPVDIGSLDYDALSELQWREERAFAALIAGSARGSERRRDLFRQAYDTVTTIYGRRIGAGGNGPAMGYDRRYAELVLELLARRPTDRPRVFEIGYGCGALLAALPDVEVAGIEVSSGMHAHACRRLAKDHHARLHVGDFLTADLAREAGTDVVFWNDVLEHLVPDDVPDFLSRIYGLLKPGGYLVTITPNWHMRPNDVTHDFCPPRTTAVGFHLKEYRLRELTVLLREAGFRRVATPLLITRKRIVLCGSGLAGIKRALEPALEGLPFRTTRLLCRALGLSCTIAQRPL